MYYLFLRNVTSIGLMASTQISQTTSKLAQLERPSRILLVYNSEVITS